MVPSTTALPDSVLSTRLLCCLLLSTWNLTQLNQWAPRAHPSNLSHHSHPRRNFVSPILAVKFFTQCCDLSAEYIWNPSLASTLAPRSSPLVY